MERVALEELEAQWEHFDALVLETPFIDAFCSSSAWTLSAHRAFHPEQEPFLFRSEDTWLAMARGTSEGIGRYLSPLEAMWGLSSPLIGPDVLGSAQRAIEALESVRDQWDALWLCGLDPEAPTFALLARHFHGKCAVFQGPSTRRHVASLEGGFEGWMGRRSRRFRASLRRAGRRAESAGIVAEWISDLEDEATRQAVYERALGVDDASWKGASDQGLRASEMASFYDHMTSRLASAGDLRVVFLRLGDRDIAMGFGALFGDAFRGLQMSYDAEFARYSPGNLIQVEFIRRLCDDQVPSYDLGTDIGYKGRWAEPGLQTVALVIRRGP
jgi:CelD/BcsL family acetyltransferase involved in cellulose biosynthesis